MAVRLAEEWFTICAGFEVPILCIGEPLLDLLPKLDIVHMPVLMDHKMWGQTGDQPGPNIPEADVGIISGSIRTQENKEIAEEMRKKCKTVIAIGSCANFGGIPALANMYTTDQIFNTVYRETKSTDPAGNPVVDIPIDRVKYLVSGVHI